MNTIVLELGARRISLRAQTFHFRQSINQPHHGRMSFYANRTLVDSFLPGLSLGLHLPQAISIKAIIISLTTHRLDNGAVFCTLNFASAWYGLNQTRRRRAWESVTLKSLFSGGGVRQKLHWRIKKDPLCDYWQYDETDAAFLLRLVKSLDAFLFTDIRDDSLWVVDSLSVLKQGVLDGYQSIKEKHSLLGRDFDLYQSHCRLMDVCRFDQKIVFDVKADYSSDTAWCFQIKSSDQYQVFPLENTALDLFHARIEAVGHDNTVSLSLYHFEAGSRLSASVGQWAFQAHWQCGYQAQIGDEVLVAMTQAQKKSKAILLASLNLPNTYHSDLLTGETALSLEAQQDICLSSGAVSFEAQDASLSSDSLDVSTQNDITLKVRRLSISASDMNLSVGGAGLSISAETIAFQSIKYSLGKPNGSPTPAIVLGDWHDCPAVDGDTPHIGGAVLQGSSSVTFNGKALARVMDPLYCQGAQDAIATGLTQILIGGKACASQSSVTAHGGKLKASQSSLYWLC